MISSQDKYPIELRASAIGCSAFTPTRIVVAPRIPDNPASLPRIPETTASWVRAPPIPTRPRAISSQASIPILVKASAIDFNESEITTTAAAPKMPENPASLPSKPEITESSTRAPPIPTRPRLTSSQDIFPNLLSALAMGNRDFPMTETATAPTTLDKPASLPRVPETTATSVRAPPIATRPRLTSSQDIEPNIFRASAILLSDCTAINKEALPTMDFFPLNLSRRYNVPTSSARAPPIATRPRAISSQERPANLDKAFANVLQDCANTTMATVDFNETLTPSITSRAFINIAIPAPRLMRPLATSSIDKPAIFFIALANILIAVAIIISDKPALTMPLVLNEANDLRIDLNVRFSIAIMVPIAPNDFITSSTLILDIAFSEADNMPIATATLTIVPTLIPSENESRASRTPLKTSLKWPMILRDFSPLLLPSSFPPPLPPNMMLRIPPFLNVSRTSEILLIVSLICLAPIIAVPANILLMMLSKETFSAIH